MKFKSELAQAAYDHMLADGRETLFIVRELSLDGDFEHEIKIQQLRLTIKARTIEVAAKIEIECLKAQFEQDERTCSPKRSPS